MSDNKIKHLLSTAYKTDAIARNKWRIENREQLREQRKKELKELMEKDKTMSNNKQQTAVEKLESFFRRHCNPSVCDIEWNDFNTAFLEAKEIGKDQHIKTWEAGLMKVDFNEYYNETYGDDKQ